MVLLPKNLACVVCKKTISDSGGRRLRFFAGFILPWKSCAIYGSAILWSDLLTINESVGRDPFPTKQKGGELIPAYKDVSCV